MESIMQAPVGILVLTNTEEVTYANQAMLSLVGADSVNEIVLKLAEIKIDEIPILEYFRKNPCATSGHIEWACTQRSEKAELIINARDISHT